MAPEVRASILPAGTVTFLLADAGPRSAGPSNPVASATSATSATSAGSAGSADPVDGRHARLARVVAEAVAARGGRGPEALDVDGAVAVFTSPIDAVAAARDIQQALAVDAESPVPPARIGLHTGEALRRDDRYYTGPALQRCARLREVAYAGQTLLSAATAALVTDALPEDTWLNDLGSHRLRDLFRPERVWELRQADLDRDLPPLRSLDGLANNLPMQLTSFVGRGQELAAVGRLVAGERLVTLTGSGGCGKTRLALQAAAELADPRRYDGVWWVDLGPVTEPGLVADVVASAIGVLVEPMGGALRALELQLRDRRLLVCLDNGEHLLDACAELAETLLLACPEVSILVTSREPLGVAGETVWRVPSLVEDEAVSLFVDRASRVRPWFTLDATNEDAVVTLCRRLDGIPLAVELAAAWLRTLTPGQIASALDDRFALLVRGPRGVIARQQTLAASIEWSHDLLDEPDRVVFRRLAVFAGGFDLAAARAVCAADPIAEPDVLGAMGRLVDKSLVLMDEPEGEDEARYRLLETIRQYASDRLGDAGEHDATRDRHLDHYLAFAEEAEPKVLSIDQDVWLGREEAEYDNLRAALEWALPEPRAGVAGDGAGPEVDPVGGAESRADRGRRLAGALRWLWYLHGYADEGKHFMARAIDAAPEERSAVQARLFSGAGAVAIAGGRFLEMAEHAQRGLEVATAVDDHADRGRCLLLLATLQFYLDLDTARELIRQAQEAGAAGDDAYAVSGGLVLEGSFLSTRDQHEEARPLLQEGYDLCLRTGNRSFAALALNYQDDAALLTGDLALADRLATQGFRLAEPLGDYYWVGNATSHLAMAKGMAGDIEEARRLLEPVVRSVEGLEQGVYIPRLAPMLGKLCLWAGDFEEARGWFAQDVPAEGPLADSLIAARSLPGLGAALRRLGRLDEARAVIDRAVALAGKLEVPHLLADATEESAWLAAATDRPDDAEDLHHRALALRIDHGLRTQVVDSLDGLASLAARAESHAEAARLLAASCAARDSMGYPRRPSDQADYDKLVADLRAAQGDTVYSDAWAEGIVLSLDEAVAYARRARGTRSRPSTGWGSLTPTELDVARLIAEGLSNPEIGARLFISRATVKTHLSHIYTKLDITNRTELASLATTHLTEG